MYESLFLSFLTNLFEKYPPFIDFKCLGFSQFEFHRETQCLDSWTIPFHSWIGSAVLQVCWIFAILAFPFTHILYIPFAACQGSFRVYILYLTLSWLSHIFWRGTASSNFPKVDIWVWLLHNERVFFLSFFFVFYSFIILMPFKIPIVLKALCNFIDICSCVSQY